MAFFNAPGSILHRRQYGHREQTLSWILCLSDVVRATLHKLILTQIPTWDPSRAPLPQLSPSRCPPDTSFSRHSLHWFLQHCICYQMDILPIQGDCDVGVLYAFLPDGTEVYHFGSWMGSKWIGSSAWEVEGRAEPRGGAPRRARARVRGTRKAKKG